MLTIQGALRWSVVKRLLPKSGSVLEIGCGQGAMGILIARDHEYVGIEPDAESFAVAHARLGKRARQQTDADVTGSFDVVCAFEVLEHIEDDRAALCRWAALVKPGGTLLVSVPAHQRMFGKSDRRVGHFRRYDPRQLDELLSTCGLGSVDVRTYAFPFGYPLHWARELLAGESGGDDGTAASGRWLQPATHARRAFATPFALMQRPFEHTGLGTGIVATAHR